ncbi:MAG: AAA family ATPase [Microthrixaceae bacterium]
MLRVEQLLVRMAAARSHTRAGLAHPDHIHAAMEGLALSDEQEVMVWWICGSGNGVDVVPGVAGSGKTHALAAARDAWNASGRTVIGVALSAQAARQLEAGSGIPSMTIARFQRALERPDPSTAPSPPVGCSASSASATAM